MPPAQPAGMNDGELTSFDWSLPMCEEDDDEIILELDPAEAPDGTVWEWNGIAWVPVEV
jgi:hypothetical protein